MKKSLLALAALAGLAAGPAIAADMPLKAPVPVAAYYNWTGWYGGINGGGQWGDATLSPGIAGTGLAPFDVEISQGLIGFHIGSQWQIGAWGPWGLVIGGEYAVSVPVEQNSNSTVAPFCSTAAGVSCGVWMDRFLQAGGRIGISYDRFLVYGTGGYVEADHRANIVTATSVTMLGQNRMDGWYAGVGAEWMFYKSTWGDWIIGAEWQHMRFDDQLTAPPNAFAAGTIYNVSSDTDIIRARLSVKINPWPLGTLLGR